MIMKHKHLEIYKQVMQTEGIDQIQYLPFFDIAVQFGIAMAMSEGQSAQSAIEHTLRLLRMEDRLETIISDNLKIVEYNEHE